MRYEARGNRSRGKGPRFSRPERLIRIAGYDKWIKATFRSPLKIENYGQLFLYLKKGLFFYNCGLGNVLDLWISDLVSLLRGLTLSRSTSHSHAGPEYW